MHMRQEPSARRRSPGSEPAPAADAFEAIYTAHHRRVLGYCARRASRTDAWDAAAEVFAIAWRRIDDVPSGDGALPWLFRVAYRVISNQRRSKHRRDRLHHRAAGLGANAGPVPEAQLIRSEEEAEVVEALLRLRDIDREILLLALWDELPREHIATVLSISRDAVDQRVARAKRRLAAKLEKWQNVGRATPIDRAEGGTT